MTAIARFDETFGEVMLLVTFGNSIAFSCSPKPHSVVTSPGVTALTYTNSSSVSSDVLHLSVFVTSASGSPCNQYELELQGTQAVVGEWTEASFCGPAVANSTGAAAVLSTAGRGSEAVMPMVFDVSPILYVENLPPQTFGLFISSPNQGNTPMLGGTQGTLCLGSQIGRHTEFIFTSSSSGTAALRQGFFQMPTPSGFSTVPIGATWNFQAWYRDDNPTPTANLTNGLSITF